MSYRHAMSLASYDNSDKEYRSSKAGVRRFIKTTCARSRRRCEQDEIMEQLEEDIQAQEDESYREWLEAEEAAMAEIQANEEAAYERFCEEDEAYRKAHPACPGTFYAWTDEFTPEQIAWAQEVASRFPLADKDWYADDAEIMHDAMYDKAWVSCEIYDRSHARMILGIQIEE